MTYVNPTGNIMDVIPSMCNNLPLTPTSLSPISTSMVSSLESRESSDGSQHDLLRRNLPNPSNWMQANGINSGQPERNINTTSQQTNDPATRRKRSSTQGICLYLYLFRSNFGYRIIFIRYSYKLKLI